jgi:hypothetical protein
MYIQVYGSLVHFAEVAESYSGNSVTKSTLVQTGLMDSTAAAIRQLGDIFDEIKSQSKLLRDLWRKFKAGVNQAWRTFLSDSTVRDFYFLLYNDVTDMINHPTQMSMLRDIFADPKMLDISPEEALRIQPKVFYQLLNADVAVIDMDTKTDDINKLFDKWLGKTDLSQESEGSKEMLLSSYNELKINLEEHRRKTTLDKQYFK